MSKKFDGPKFLNPNHTSSSLNNGGTYQTPQISFSTKEQPSSDSSMSVGPVVCKQFFGQGPEFGL